MKFQSKMQKGIVIPLLALGVLLVLGGVLYYYSHKAKTDLAQNSGNLANVNTTSTPAIGSYMPSSTPATNTPKPTKPVSKPTQKPVATKPPAKPTYTAPVYSANTASVIGSGLREVSGQGVLAERLGWNTQTNREYSYAISFPASWAVSGSGNLISAFGGGIQVSVQAQMLSGQDLATFASQSGALNASVTTVNGYTAVKSFEGGQTVYYIQNGNIGYRISISGYSQSDVVRAVLLTFTFTAQR